MFLRIFPFLLLGFAPALLANIPNSLNYYEDAVARYSQEDYKGAEVQLKNTLQADPKNLPARLLLGQVQLWLANPAAAEKELTLALRLGAARDKVFPTLGNALLLQRKYTEILDVITTVNSSTPEAEQVYIFRGRAHLGLGQLDEAYASFEKAELLNTDGLEGLLGKSAVLAVRGEYAEAETLVDKAVELYPENVEAQYTKGLLRAVQGDSTSALGIYNKILVSDSTSNKTRVARAIIYMRLDQYQEASEDLQIVHENVRSDLKAAFLYARVLGQLGRNDEAKAVLDDLSGLITRVREDVLHSNPELLRTATLLYYLKGDIEQAITYGNRYLDLKPRDMEMGKLLAAMQLRVGGEDEAIQLLYAILRQRPDDAEVLTLLGEAHLKKSQYGVATQLLEKAASLAPDSAAIGTRLSLGRFGLGLDEEGESELLRSFELNTAESVSAGFILAQIQLRKGETDSALAIIETLIESQPRNPMLYNLLGAAYLQGQNFAAARKSFGVASKVSPGFLGSEYNLALLDIHEAHYVDARRRLLQLVEIHPQSILVLVALSDLELAEGYSDRAIPWLEKATALENSSVIPGIRLVDLYIQYDDLDNAMRQAENLVRLYPGDPEAYAALARVQIARGQGKDAVGSLRKAVQQTSISAGNKLIGLADQQVRLGDHLGARKTLIKAGSSGQASDAQAALIRLDLMTGQYEAAEQGLERLNQLTSNKAVLQLLMGDIRYSQKRYKEAFAAYRESFDLSPGTLSAIGVFKSQFLMGHQDAAHIWLANWCVAHPEDAMSRRTLARSQLSTGKRLKAREGYEQLIEDGYGKAIDYSFLARIYQLDKDDRALEVAKLALELDPESARILDVYGWILVTEGRAADGLPYLREAVSRDSDLFLRYHLASALNEVGRIDEARLELQAILRSKQELPWIGSAQVLFDSLPATE